MARLTSHKSLNAPAIVKKLRPLGVWADAFFGTVAVIILATTIVMAPDLLGNV